MRIVLVILLLAGPASAEWQRRVVTPKGDHNDMPGPHPLEYFTRSPLLSDGYEFCWNCSPEERITQARTATDKAEVQEVGQAHQMAVLDLMVSEKDDDRPYRKSVLIERKPGEYFEVYQVEPNLGGPVRLDFDTIFAAARTACPTGVDPWRGFGNLRKRLPDSHIFVGTRDDWGHPASEASSK